MFDLSDTSSALGRLSRLAWCLVAGLAASATYPPHDLVWLAWLAPIPWLVALRNSGHLGALGLGFVYGAAQSLALGSWVPGVISGGFGAAPPAAWAIGIVLCLSFVPAVMVVSWTLSRVGPESPLYAPIAGVLIALAEVSYGELWPGIPWITHGATQIDTPIAAAASVVGVHGVSGLVVGTSALAVQIVSRVRWVRWVPCGALLVVAGLGATFGGSSTGHRPTGPPLRIAIVQPAVPMPDRMDSRYQKRSLAILTELTEPIRDVDLVVWPETSLIFTLEGRPDVAKQIASLAEQVGAPIILGAPRKARRGRLNSAMILRPGEGPVPAYDKLLPLPVAEHRPGWLPTFMRRALGWFSPAIPWTFGDEVRIDLSDLADPEIVICYEAAFSRRSRNSEAGFILNLVNDGWYDRTKAAEHHFLLARWRAIEAEATLVRATTTGTSAVVGAHGELLGTLPPQKPGVFEHSVQPEKARTAFERFGYFPLACFGLVLVAAELLVRLRRRPSGTGSRNPEITE